MEQEFASDAGYLDFFKTRGNRWRLAILVSLGVISQYSGNAIFSNYMDAVYIGAGIVDQDRKLAVSLFFFFFFSCLFLIPLPFLFRCSLSPEYVLTHASISDSHSSAAAKPV